MDVIFCMGKANKSNTKPDREREVERIDNRMKGNIDTQKNAHD